MRAIILGAMAIGLAAATPAFAQYEGPGVKTCADYALKQLKRDDPAVKAVEIINDKDLEIDKYTEKVGSQFVSSILSGNGFIRGGRSGDGAGSFVCLLESDRRAVFFFFRSKP